MPIGPSIPGLHGGILGCHTMAVLDAVRTRIPLDVRHRIAQGRVSARTPTGPWRRLPDLLVIGAQRCGTSTLYRHLGRHPDVAPSLRKEVEYFSRRYWRGERWYRAHFALAAGRRRRASRRRPTTCSTRSRRPGRPPSCPTPGSSSCCAIPSPGRGRTTTTWSGSGTRTSTSRRPWRPSRSAAPTIWPASATSWHDPVALLRYSYVARGHYAEQLARWLDVFPRKRLLVVRSEDFFRDPTIVPAHRRLRRAGAVGSRELQQRQPTARRRSTADAGRGERATS